MFQINALQVLDYTPEILRKGFIGAKIKLGRCAYRRCLEPITLDIL